MICLTVQVDVWTFSGLLLYLGSMLHGSLPRCAYQMNVTALEALRCRRGSGWPEWCVAHTGMERGQVCEQDLLPGMRAPCYRLSQASGGTERCLPTLFIAGIAKAGTSALYDMLVQHDQVFGNLLRKEIHYWDSWASGAPAGGRVEQMKWGAGIRDYDQNFPSAQQLGRAGLSIEATPTVWHSWVAEPDEPHALHEPQPNDATLPSRLVHHMPWLKTIILLRSPLRWLSSCWAFFYNGDRTQRATATAGNFHTWLVTRNGSGWRFQQSSTWDGIWYRSVANWLRSFPLHVATRIYRQEDMMVNQSMVIKDIEEYAGLIPMELKVSTANRHTTSFEHLGEGSMRLNQTDMLTALKSIGHVTDPLAPVNFGILAHTRSIICQASVGAYHQLGALTELDLADYFDGCKHLHVKP